MHQMQFGIVLPGNVRSALYGTFGKGGKIGGGNNTADVGHDGFPSNQRVTLFIIVIPLKSQR
jgi:hypothetical protein